MLKSKKILPLKKMTNIELPDFKNFKAKEKLARIKSLFAAMIQIVGKDRGILRPTLSR